MSQVPKGEERHPYACKQPGRESQQHSSWPIQNHFRWAAPLNDLPLLLLHLLKQTVSSPQLESYLSEEKYKFSFLRITLLTTRKNGGKNATLCKLLLFTRSQLLVGAFLSPPLFKCMNKSFRIDKTRFIRTSLRDDALSLLYLHPLFEIL